MIEVSKERYEYALAQYQSTDDATKKAYYKAIIDCYEKRKNQNTTETQENSVIIGRCVKYYA